MLPTNLVPCPADLLPVTVRTLHALHTETNINVQKKLMSTFSPKCICHKNSIPINIITHDNDSIATAMAFLVIYSLK